MVLGRVIETNFIQSKKAQSPIVSTPVGMSNISKQHESKACLPIILTPLGIIVALQPTTRVLVAFSIIALVLFAPLVYLGLSLATVIVFNVGQSENGLG